MVLPSRAKDEDWHGTVSLYFKGRHFRIATQRANVNELCCQRGPQTTVDCESKKLSWISVVSFVILNSGATASGYCLRCIRDCCHSASSRNHDLRLDPLSTVLLQGFQLQKHIACHVLLMVIPKNTDAVSGL